MCLIRHVKRLVVVLVRGVTANIAAAADAGPQRGHLVFIVRRAAVGAGKRLLRVSPNKRRVGRPAAVRWSEGGRGGREARRGGGEETAIVNEAGAGCSGGGITVVLIPIGHAACVEEGAVVVPPLPRGPVWAANSANRRRILAAIMVIGATRRDGQLLVENVVGGRLPRGKAKVRGRFEMRNDSTLFRTVVAVFGARVKEGLVSKTVGVGARPLFAREEALADGAVGINAVISIVAGSLCPATGTASGAASAARAHRRKRPLRSGQHRRDGHGAVLLERCCIFVVCPAKRAAREVRVARHKVVGRSPMAGAALSSSYPTDGEVPPHR